MKRLEPGIIDYYNSEVVMMIAEKYGLNQKAALKVFVSSKTHEMLENADCGMTDFGAKAIFEIWECEKVTGDPRNSVYISERNSNITEEMKFFIYLLEYYASYKNRKTGDVLEEWEKCGITQKIYDNYWLYHTERIENAYMDIDSLIKTGKPAW